jgi:hypothetical protein
MNRSSKQFFSLQIKGYLYTFVYIAVAMSLLSCEETMDVNLTGDSAKKLVVEGSITTDTMAHKVILSYSNDYYTSTEQEMATGAWVSITNGVDTFLLSETPSGSGIYYTEPDVYGVPDRTYTLNVMLPDNEEYTASDYLKPCTKLDSIKQTANYDFSNLGYGYDVLYFADEPEPAGDCYLFLLYMNSALYSDTITQVYVVDDEFVNGNYISNLAAYHIYEKDLIDTTYVTLEILSTSRKYYDFMYALWLETVWKGFPWDGPPANIPGNISNGGFGFFRASDVHRASRYFVPTPRIN